MTGESLAAGDAAVTLVAPDGSSQTFHDEEGDGSLSIRPQGPEGNYRVTITAGEHRVTRTVTLLGGGEVVLTYDQGDEVAVAYRGLMSAEDEIVVTARKREENLQQIPVSVAAFTGEQLESREVRSLRDVGDFAPNVDFSITNGLGGTTSEATVYIRGIGQIDTALFADPGVGIYVDGVYLARAGGSVLDLLDLERVEILRGPQGTLFGKNTTGGAISLITRKPGPDRAFEIDLTGGENDRLDLRASANLPLSDKAFVTVAAASTNRDGFAESLANGERLADDNRDALRASLRWLPNESTVVDVCAEVAREREKAADQPLLAIVSTPLIDFYNTVLAGSGFTPISNDFVTGDLRTSNATAESRNDGDVGGATVTVTWTSGEIDLTSISAFRQIEFDVASDGDGSPVRLAERSFLQNQEQLSQEIHVSGRAYDDRLSWLVGGLYFTESSDEDSLTLVLGDLFEALEAAPGPIYAPPGVPGFLCSPGPPPPGVPCFGGAGNPANFAFFLGAGDFERIDLETDSWALFGEGTYEVSDRLSATFGLRYTLEEKRFDFFRDPGSGAPDVVLSNRDDWDALSPRFSLAYQLTEDALVYASAARGFKSGGFNGRPQDRLALDPFDPETVWSYELGWKTDFADNRVRLNGAAFYNDYTDIQFSASLNIDGTPFFVIQNAGQAEVQGFELELAAQPARGFDLTAGVGYIDTEYTELDNVDGVTLDGVLPKTPDWTFNISPQYAFPVQSGGTVTLRADYRYRGEVFNDVSNTPLIAQDAYGLLGARVAWTSQSTDLEVALFGTNLTDEQYLEHGFFAAAFGAAVGVSGRPREWGLTVRRRF
ncbi:MAG: TonB-dependent receptor [Acidobacteriota bacterium]